MSKFEIRSPVLLTAAALVLAPALVLAAGDKKSPAETTTTTTTTTSPQGSTTVTPPTSNDMNPSTASSGNQADQGNLNNPNLVDPAQVQKVFGMDVALIDLKALNSEQLKVMQQRLADRGFYRGAIDGKMGPGTRNALSGLMAQQHALNQRLVNQGQITEQFASSLGVDLRGRIPVTGVDPNDQPSQHPQPRSNAQSTTPTPPPHQPAPNQ